MKDTDIIQKLSFWGFPYARVLSHEVNSKEAEEMKKHYAYIQIYSFTKQDLLGFTLRTQQTPVFDLSQDPEEIFCQFNSTCKKHIRRGERNGDLKIVALDDNIDESYALYKRIKIQEGAKPDLQREFKNCPLFNAYLDGQMIVTMSLYDNGEIIRAKHIASVRKEKEYAKVVAQASRRITWEVIKWGHHSHKKMFDNGGITNDPAKAGIREFKQSFGGKEVEVYIYRYTTPIFSFLKKIVSAAGLEIH